MPSLFVWIVPRDWIAFHSKSTILVLKSILYQDRFITLEHWIQSSSHWPIGSKSSYPVHTEHTFFTILPGCSPSSCSSVWSYLFQHLGYLFHSEFLSLLCVRAPTNESSDRYVAPVFWFQQYNSVLFVGVLWSWTESLPYSSPYLVLSNTDYYDHQKLI